MNQVWTGRSSATRMRVSVAGFVAFVLLTTPAFGQGEPAEAFVKQLRNAGYFDTAITYLDRVSKFPGVDPEFVSAIELEKAQTHIDAALRSRNSNDRDEAFTNAENALQSFLKKPSHPRAPEARLQLGKLQLFRASQFLAGEVDASARQSARDSYLAASKTFDGIVSDLRGKLEQLKGQSIDPKTDPEAAKRRDEYRFQYLQSQLNAADALKLAGKTAKDRKKDGKANLDEASKRFTELNKKYHKYAEGAVSLMHLGQIAEWLGQDAKAEENFLLMLEQPEADNLRDAKFLAAAGYARLKLKQSPPKYKEAIDRVSPWVREIRPNEKTAPSVQEFRLALAKAYLANAADEAVKRGEAGRATSEGRELLQDASKVPGSHLEEVRTLLADMGIDKNDAPKLPTAEPPKSFEDAIERAREVYVSTGEIDKGLKLLAKQDETPQLKQQKQSLEKQLVESYSVGSQVLRAGLVMVNKETDNETINQARFLLTYFLYQQRLHRDAVVTGSFLARHAPGAEMGLRGGLIALNAMQMLLTEVPEDQNDGLMRQLESLGNYLTKTWPNDPKAAEAQGIRIRLLLRKDDYDGAQALIDKMPAGRERGYFKRLLGQLLWNASVLAREAEDLEKSDLLAGKAIENLQQGLDELEGNADVEVMKAALVLAKIHQFQKNADKALTVLDHPKFGPAKLVETLGSPSETFTREFRKVELKALVGKMLKAADPSQSLDRMTTTMEALRQAFQGPDAQSELAAIYIRLANDIKEELELADPARQAKLIEAFRALLQRISDATDDQATNRWVGQTLMSMGETLMQPGQTKATGQALDLITQANRALQKLEDQDDVTTGYLVGRSHRLIGEYQPALNAIQKVLTANPNTLDAQFEGAQTYESWAADLKPTTGYKAYSAALKGGRPGADKKNTIWGWDAISQKTSRNPQFRDKFFESRYHVAYVLYRMGTLKKRKSELQQASKVINRVEALFPEMGGAKMKAKYQNLLKQVEKGLR
ncbi:MAG: hypothetical protein AAFX06_26560 [Planctomycetota bacterium]